MSSPGFVPDQQTTSGFVPDSETANPSAFTPDVAGDAWKAGVHGRMLGISPSYAYQNRETIDKQMHERGGDYDTGELEPTIVNDIKVGLEGSIFGLHHREKLPEEVRDPGVVDKFVEGLSQMVADIPFFITGGIAGGVAGSEVPVVGNAIGAAAGGFALPAAVRKALVLGIQNGEVKDFRDLMHRASDVTLEATKGAAVGVATELAGGLPVGKLSGAAAITMKGLYQATALTTAADLLEGKVPTLKDFVSNSALIIPLNLVTHGLPMKGERAKQALMDVYADKGTTPQETSAKLAAQPTVKAEQPEGLRAAIEFKGKGTVISNAGETHDELSQRSLVQKPITMEELESDPKVSDKVLQQPEIHDQAVIDKAWQMKEEAVARGEGATKIERYDEEGKSPNADKPHGTYFTLKQEGVDSPHKDIGPSHTSGEISGQNTLEVTPADVKHARFAEFEHGSASTGVAALKQLTSPEEFEQLRKMDKAGLVALLDKEFPGPDYSKYYDSYELLEALAGQRARAAGYDSLIMRDKEMPEFSEYVALKSESYRTKPLTINDLYDRSAMRSGRGFVTPDGKFLTREQARSWVKENEPEVHARWSEDAGGDKAEFHSEDYHEARQRVADANVASGEEALSKWSPELTKGLSSLRAGLNEIKAGDESTPYGESVVRTLFTGPRNALRAEGEQVSGRLRTLIPDARDQEALSFLRDYRDDPDALRKDIEQIRDGDNEKLKAFIPSMERALSPSPEMMQADKELTDYFTKSLALGRQMGTLQSSIDPSRYSPRLFAIAQDEATQSGIGRPKFTEKTPHAIQRENLRLLDPLKSGDLVTARTFNALDELSIYADRHSTAVATKLFTTELKNSELGIHGTADEHPVNWTELRGSGGVFVPPVIADAMEPILESAPRSGAINKFLHIQSIVKAAELVLSVFHMKAMAITAMNNMSLNGYIEAMHSDNSRLEFEAAERGAALHGVTTTKTGPAYEAYRGLRESSVPTGLDKLSDVPVIKQADAIAKRLTKDTFDVIQRKFKVIDFSTKEAAWVKNHPNATAAEYGSAMRGYAKEVNAAYGGLNWEVMGVSKAMQNVSRLFLLAPDWTFSNIANLKYAAEGGLKGTEAANASRMFFAKSFATGIAMTAAMSTLVGGRYDFDPKHFDQVYLGKDKDGKEMYASWFFAGAPKDAIALAKRTMKDGVLAGLAETIVSKAAPVAGAVIGLATNKEYSGKPIYKKSDSAVKQTEEQSAYLAEKVAPFTVVNLVQSVKKALSDPNHQYSYRDILELISDTIGATPYHEADPTGPTKGVGPGMSKARGFSIRNRGIMAK